MLLDVAYWEDLPKYDMVKRNIKRAWIGAFFMTPIVCIYPYYKLRRPIYFRIAFVSLGCIYSLAGIFEGLRSGY